MAEKRKTEVWIPRTEAISQDKLCHPLNYIQDRAAKYKSSLGEGTSIPTVVIRENERNQEPERSQVLDVCANRNGSGKNLELAAAAAPKAQH